MVLKVLSLTSEGSTPATSSETHVLYWKREALVYQSDLLDDLPGGVRGPRCYAITEQPDGSVWLWLEEVKEIYGPRWPLEQYARAAHHLGHMNGAYLAGRPLPSYPWLVRTGSPRGLLEHCSTHGCVLPSLFLSRTASCDCGRITMQGTTPAGNVDVIGDADDGDVHSGGSLAIKVSEK